jgi:hypothetical protein
MEPWSRLRLVVAGGVLCSVFVAAACAPMPRGEPPPLPEHTITFYTSYNASFDRILRTLRGDGYDIAVADREAGIIQTRPKALAREETNGGPLEYRTFFLIMVRGSWRESLATVDLVVLPSYPKERDTVIKQLEEKLRTRGE